MLFWNDLKCYCLDLVRTVAKAKHLLWCTHFCHECISIYLFSSYLSHFLLFSEHLPSVYWVKICKVVQDEIGHRLYFSKWVAYFCRWCLTHSHKASLVLTCVVVQSGQPRMPIRNHGNMEGGYNPSGYVHTHTHYQAPPISPTHWLLYTHTHRGMHIHTQSTFRGNSFIT